MGVLDIIRGRQVVAPLTNKSGGSLSEGAVVIIDTTADDAFTTTTISQDKKIMGVVAETIANDAAGRVIINGYVPVLAADAATSRGDYLHASSSAGKATPSSTLVQGVFGVALSAVGAAGNISALIWPMAPYAEVGHIILQAKDGWPTIMNGSTNPGVVYVGATNKICMYSTRFDTDSDDYFQWTTPMPDNWDGDTITAKVYWTCSGGGANETVSWDLSGRSYGNDEALDQATGTAVTVNDTWIADMDLHVTAEIAAITLAGTPAGGELAHIQIVRDVSDDDLGVDAHLLAVHITYTKAFAVVP